MYYIKTQGVDKYECPFWVNVCARSWGYHSKEMILTYKELIVGKGL